MAKILIADDNKETIDLLSLQLEKKGYAVFKAMDGAMAVQEAFRLKPDLIILDMMLPAGSGVTVFSRLQQSVLTQKIPLIILTALSLSQVKENIPSIDDSIIFTKPWNMEELLSAVRKQVETVGEKS